MTPLAALGIAGCLGAIAASLWVITEEWKVSEAETAFQTQLLAAARGDPPIGPETIAQNAPARGRLLDALRLASVATSTPNPAQRRSLLDRAATEIGHIEATRPGWADAATGSAYVLALRDGTTSMGARDALARSYAAAPFLRHAAPWRVATGVANWAQASDATREAIVDEAVWLSRFSPEANDAVLGLVRGTPAYQPFFVRWRALRMSDPVDA